jgi:hypothetical protein
MALGQNFRVILRRSMDISTVVMMAAAVVTLVVVYWKSPQAAAFTLAGLIQAVVPQETIVRWIDGWGMDQARKGF